MKKILLFIILFAFSFVKAQNPKQFLNPMVWLRADHIESDAQIWNDYAAKKNNAVPLKGFDFTAFGSINFNKAVLVEGNYAGFEIPVDLSTTSQLTIIAVYFAGAQEKEMGVWSTRINADQHIFQSTQRGGGPQSIARFSDGNVDIPIVVTTTQYWGKSGKGVDNPVLYLAHSLVDSANVAPFEGLLAEFLVFDRMISELEFQVLQSYLSLKYGTTFQYASYVNYKGQVIWDYISNEEYSYGIGGIGRDDDMGLYQKQSSSVEEPGLLTIGAGYIAASNHLNTTTFHKDNYLIWSMNGKDLQPERSTQEIYPYKYPVMNRKWKMNVSNNPASRIPTEIRFDASELLGVSRECYLIIDRSGRGDFTSDSIEYIAADEISDKGIATFRNILWDRDGTTSDIFTFSFGMNNGVSCTYPVCHDDLGTIHVEVMGSVAPYTFTLINEATGTDTSWESYSRFYNIENLNAGNYELRVQGGDGKIAVDAISIPEPDQFTTGLMSEYVLKLGEKLVLDAGKNVSGHDLEFIWHDQDQVIQATASELSIITPGEYTVILTSNLGCVVSETITIKASKDYSYHYKLFPNPSFGDYTLELILAEKSPATISLYNIHGNFIREQRWDSSIYHVHKDYINDPGVYLLVVETDLGREVFKLIVNNH